MKLFISNTYKYITNQSQIYFKYSNIGQERMIFLLRFNLLH